MSKTQAKNAKGVKPKNKTGHSTRSKGKMMPRKTPAEIQAGRPEVYDPNYHPMWAERYAMLRFTDAEICACFYISESTLRLWKSTYPEFSAAIKNGGSHADGMVASKLYERAIGAKTTKQMAFKVKAGKDREVVEIVDLIVEEPPETKAAMFWLNNRNSKKWKDKSTVEVEGSDDLMQIMAEARARAHKAQEDGK